MTKPNANHYFTQVHEDAIIKYALSTDRMERTKLYVKFIQPAFDEMVNKIIFHDPATASHIFDSLLSPFDLSLSLVEIL